jgi:N-acetylmuramoyl-L-alanine amidase
MIALCVGHSRKGDSGALTTQGRSEHSYNFALAGRVRHHLLKQGVACFKISHYPRVTYTSAMDWLAQHLRERGATAAIELHFNSSTRVSAQGHEWLHWHASRNGLRLAECFNRAMRAHFPDRPVRGLISLGSAGETRTNGTQFVRKTHCPAIIAEPFFGSNAAETELFTSPQGLEQLALAYVAAITDYTRPT